MRCLTKCSLQSLQHKRRYQSFSAFLFKHVMPSPSWFSKGISKPDLSVAIIYNFLCAFQTHAIVSANRLATKWPIVWPSWRKAHRKLSCFTSKLNEIFLVPTLVAAFPTLVIVSFATANYGFTVLYFFLILNCKIKPEHIPQMPE